jgi:hypothetical protein
MKTNNCFSEGNKHTLVCACEINTETRAIKDLKVTRVSRVVEIPLLTRVTSVTKRLCRWFTTDYRGTTSSKAEIRCSKRQVTNKEATSKEAKHAQPEFKVLQPDKVPCTQHPPSHRLVLGTSGLVALIFLSSCTHCPMCGQHCGPHSMPPAKTAMASGAMTQHGMHHGGQSGYSPAMSDGLAPQPSGRKISPR